MWQTIQIPACRSMSIARLRTTRDQFNGSGIQIWRKLTIQLDQTRVLDLGPMAIAQKQQRSQCICVFSRNSYRTLERYIEAMRQGMQRNGQGAAAQNAMTMALIISMLGALNTDDDD